MPPQKPTLTAPLLHAVPPNIRDLQRWVVWRLEWEEPTNDKPGRWTKRPYNPRAWDPVALASSTNPETWGTFEAARARFEGGGGDMDGIGIVLGEGLAGVDFDHVVTQTPEGNLEIEPQALARICALDSYTERSPSGTGVHVLLFGKLPSKEEGGHRRKDNLEMYDSGRYFTFTGDTIDGRRVTVEERQKQLDALHEEVWPRALIKVSTKNGAGAASEPGPDLATLTIDERIHVAFNAKNARAIVDLWHGNWEGSYSSQSEADLALLNYLAFYSGPFPDVLMEMFSRSKLAERAKWADRPDYRAASVEKALDGRTEFYRPPRKRGAHRQEGTIEGPFGIKLDVKERRRTSSRMNLRCRIQLNGSSPLSLDWNSSGTSIEKTAVELFNFLPSEAATGDAKVQLKRFLRELVEREQGAAQEEEKDKPSDTSLTIMLREAESLDLRFKAGNHKAWSERHKDYFYARNFVELMISHEVLNKLQCAVDLEDLKTGALISTAERVAKSTWAQIMRTLPEQTSIDLGPTSAAAEETKQTIITIWTAPLEIERPDGLKRKMSLVSMAHTDRRIVAEEDPEYCRWHRIPPYSAWWRRVVNHERPEYRFAMRHELVRQVQAKVTIPGIRTLEDLRNLLARYGLADKESGRVGSNRDRVAVLSAGLCEELSASIADPE